jgi:hypothetical protein
MRDVTPVEALDMKLACIAGLDRILVEARRNPTMFYQPFDAESIARDGRYLRRAVPVAWSLDTFKAIQAAAHTYPPEQWPVTPVDESLRLYVLPESVFEHDDARGLYQIRVFLTGFTSVAGERVFMVAGLVYDDDHKIWSTALRLQMPPRTSLDELDAQVASFKTTKIYKDRRAKLLAWIFASWAFLDQRIAVEERAPVERHARKRAERLDVDPVVHVVRLRKPERRADAGDAERDVEWSCQWLVRGHWRNQWHPRMQRHAPVWITPHIKGPADMPLKTPAPEVWQVAR